MTPKRSASPSDRRRLMRRDVTIGASVNGTVTRQVPVSVRDISCTGCRIAARARFHPGDLLSLRLPTLAPLGGAVVWARDQLLGFEFAQPLHPAVLTKIVADSRAG